MRYTSRAMITLLLLHGGWVLSTLHKLNHHTAPALTSLCDHDTSNHKHDDHRRTPMPVDDQRCSVCLGLSGLHMAGAPAPACMVMAPVYEHLPPESPTVRPAPAPLRRCPARAPPIC